MQKHQSTYTCVAYSGASLLKLFSPFIIVIFYPIKIRKIGYTIQTILILRKNKIAFSFGGFSQKTSRNLIPASLNLNLIEIRWGVITRVFVFYFNSG